MSESAGTARPAEVLCLTDVRPLRVRPVGDIDLTAKAQLDAALDTIAAQLPADVVLDLSATTFLDSTGLAFLVRLDRQVRAAGRTLTLIEPHAAVYRVLELSGLDRVLTIRRSRP